MLRAFFKKTRKFNFEEKLDDWKAEIQKAHQELQELRKYTERLPQLLIIPNLGDSIFTHYNVEKGKAKSKGLVKIPEVAVAQTFISKGAKFKSHAHMAIEYVVVYKGQLKMRIDGKEYLIEAGDSLCIRPNIAHVAEALTDVELIAITIPASEDFPSVRQNRV